jgi:hypothetical protein
MVKVSTRDCPERHPANREVADLRVIQKLDDSEQPIGSGTGLGSTSQIPQQTFLFSIAVLVIPTRQLAERGMPVTSTASSESGVQFRIRCIQYTVLSITDKERHFKTHFRIRIRECFRQK